MFLSYLILALSVSIDSLGIGITYGFRNTTISFSAKIILFIISVIVTYLALLFGNIINSIIPSYITLFLGGLFLIIMGIWIIYQAISKKTSCNNSCLNEPKIYNFFIKFLGITIQIIRNPISSDLDNSKKIDWKEALYLGIALSIDSICVGICSSIIGYNSIIFPFLVAIFQLFFLSIGSLLGKKFSSIYNVSDNIWNILSGVLLICIGVSRFVI